MKKKISKGSDTAKVKTVSMPSEDDMLAVLVDVYSKREHYMSFIDSFYTMGREYTVMYKFEPDDGSHPEPEIVILRNEPGIGERVFKSIKDRRELQNAFDVFFERFREHGGL
jgi:hypothetical protein